MRITFPNLVGNIEIYMDCLRAICGHTEGKSMIDLCSAFAPNTPKLGFSRRHYVDIIDRKLDHVEEQEYFEKGNALEMDDIIHYYDVALALDAIEHFYPEDGKKLLKIMQDISHKQIIFTPLGEIFKLHNTGADDPEAHHSLWTPDDFPGWATIVFPKYHEAWNGGAFFAIKCENIIGECERIFREVVSKQWTFDQVIEHQS